MEGRAGRRGQGGGRPKMGAQTPGVSYGVRIWKNRRRALALPLPRRKRQEVWAGRGRRPSLMGRIDGG